jgi:hypothetical protein
MLMCDPHGHVEEVLGRPRDPVEAAERILNSRRVLAHLVRRDDQPGRPQRCDRVIGEFVPEGFQRLLAGDKGRPRLVEALEEPAYAR